MAIRLAFSTTITSELSLAQAAAKAKELGLAGLELRSWHGAQGAAGDVATMDPKTVGTILADAGLQAVSVSSSLSYHGLKQPTDVLRSQTERSIELALAIGAPAVRVFAGPVAVGQSVRQAVQGIAHHVRPVLDQAQAARVLLLLENTATLSQPQAWWWLMDLLDHPMAKVSWNPSLSLLADANDLGGAVAVPTLHRRLGLVKLTDTAPSGRGLMQRLLGIAYDGFVSFDGSSIKTDSLAQAKEVVQGWLDDIAKAQNPPKKAPVAAAAKPAAHAPAKPAAAASAESAPA